MKLLNAEHTLERTFDSVDDIFDSSSGKYLKTIV